MLVSLFLTFLLSETPLISDNTTIIQKNTLKYKNSADNFTKNSLTTCLILFNHIFCKCKKRSSLQTNVE